jgi:hypothetical protein
MYSLKEFNDEKNYKSYAELKAKLHRVLGEGSEDTLTTAESISLDETSSAPSYKSSDSSSAEASAAPAAADNSSSDNDDDDDDTLSYFAKLAAQD